MDQYLDDSGSDEDSITPEIERGDAVIVYECTDRRYSPPVNHVTKVLIGPSNPKSSTLCEMTIFTNEPKASEAAYSGNANQKLSSPFLVPSDHALPSQTQVKQYEELAEELSHQTVGGQGREVSSQGLIPVSPALSKKFRNSLRTDVSSPSNNPFLTDADAAQTNSSGLPNGGSPGIRLGPANAAAVSTGIHQNIKQNPESISTPLSGGPGTIIDPPGAFKTPDLLGNATILVAAPAQGSSQSNGATVGSARTTESVISGNSSSMNLSQATPPDVTIQPQKVNSQSAEPLVSGTIQPAPSQPDPPMNVQIVNAACSQELPPIQESLNTTQSESSFHFPESQRPAPLVCVPVKEVKFEEPPKHQIVTAALENAVEKLGEIVQITVQPCHSTHNAVKAIDEPNVIALPTYSASQFQQKVEDCSSVPPTTCQANNTQKELKMINHKIEEAEIPADPPSPDENEQSYGIIGNEDNLSEITLPPLAEGRADHRDHDSGAYSNGHPRHRIRISIDQESATPSRRAMVITVLLIVLAISTVIFLGVYYKFVHKISPV